VRLQRFDEHRKMPWKNGLGVTREVAIHAPAEEPSAFLWRISLATVSGSGPFSAFPGIDRTIAVLRGGGLHLTVDGVAQQPLTEEAEPFSFSGDAIVHSDSIGGETTDLNVMTRRGVFTHTVRKVTREGECVLSIESGTTAVVFNGQASVSLPDGIIAVDFGDVLLDLDPIDSLYFSTAGNAVSVFLVDLREAGKC
jgi:Uncharacterized protein conserved in bacteria